LGENIGPIPEGLYPGNYLKRVGKALASEFGRTLLDEPKSTWVPVVRSRAVEALLRTIRADLAALKVRHNTFFSERPLTERRKKLPQAAIETLAIIVSWRVVTLARIKKIRGAEPSKRTINILMQTGWIRRRVGRATTYEITEIFLLYLGL